MDECEILEWGGDSQYMVESMHSTESVDVNDESHSTPKSSHELLVMSSDGATPKNVRDGQFGKSFHVCTLLFIHALSFLVQWINPIVLV